MAVMQAAMGSPEPSRQSLDVPPSLIYQSSCQYFSWPILEPQVTISHHSTTLQLPPNVWQAHRTAGTALWSVCTMEGFIFSYSSLTLRMPWPDRQIVCSAQNLNFSMGCSLCSIVVLNDLCASWQGGSNTDAPCISQGND